MVIKMVKTKTFKEKIDACKMKGQVTRILEAQSTEFLQGRSTTLHDMIAFFGLTMRDEWIMAVIDAEICRRQTNKEMMA